MLYFSALIAVLSTFAIHSNAFAPSHLSALIRPSPRGSVLSGRSFPLPYSSRCQLLSLKAALSEVTMPALSSTMKEGKIVQWTKSVGDKVDAGDIVMVVESDKADMDVESFESGYLAKIIVPEGSSAAVGKAEIDHFIEL